MLPFMFESTLNITERYNMAKDKFGFLNYGMDPVMFFYNPLKSPADMAQPSVVLENCPDTNCAMIWTQTESGMCRVYNRPSHREAYQQNTISDKLAEMLNSKQEKQPRVKNIGSGRLYQVDSSRLQLLL